MESTRIYLQALRSVGKGWMEIDLCRDHPARDKGFIVNRSGKGPPLLYLPGYHSDDLSLFRLRPLLDADFTVYSVRYRVEGPHTADAYTDDALRALDALGIERVGLIGESMGSIPGLRLALDHPDRVAGLALAGGFTDRLSSLLMLPSWIGVWAMPTFLVRRAMHFCITKVWVAHGEGAHPPKELVDAFLKMRDAPHRRAMRGRLGMIQGWSCKDRLSELRCPVFYLAGQRDELIPVRREIRRLEREVADFEHASVPKCLHAVLFMCPESSARELRGFFGRVFEGESADEAAAAAE